MSQPDPTILSWSLKGVDPLTSTDQATSAHRATPLRGSADFRASSDALQDAVELLVSATPDLGVSYDPFNGWVYPDHEGVPDVTAGDILLELLPRVRPELAIALADLLTEAVR